MDRQLDEEDVEGSRRIAVLIFQPSFVVKSVVRKPLVSAIIGLTVLSGAWGGIASADPPHDSVANLSELSQQAEQLPESLRYTYEDSSNRVIRAGVKRWPNARLADWNAVSYPQRRVWMWGDGIHLTPTGCRAFARLVVGVARA